MSPAFFSVKRKAKERYTTMSTDEKMNLHENAVSKVVLTEEMISKIREFASEHSDGIEDADKLQNVLEELLSRIISYCCMGKIFSGSRNTDLVEVYVVPALEGLSVNIEVPGGELRECFEREITQEVVENCFLRLLGFRKLPEAVTMPETKKSSTGH